MDTSKVTRVEVIDHTPSGESQPASEYRRGVEDAIKAVEEIECSEKCNQGHIFEGYGGEGGEEESWGACPLCIKVNEYDPVVKKIDILSRLNSLIEIEL